MRWEVNMTVSEKAAYLKGLADGLEYDTTTKEGKLIKALIDLVGEMAEEVERLNDDCEYLNDYIEEIDEDLGEVEEYLADGDCDCCDCCDDADYEDEDDEDDEDYFEVECPSCGRTVCFGADIDPENLTCPACGEKFECIMSDDDLEKLDGSEEK